MRKEANMRRYISSNRPEGVPGQWWHLTEPVILVILEDRSLLDAALTFRDRCSADGRDHINATYYVDAATGAYHLLAKAGVVPRDLLYARLRCKFSVEVSPDAPVRMQANFSSEHGLWRFVANFSSEGKPVAEISGVAAQRIVGG